MNPPENQNQPIGYWVKQVDNLLTKQIDKAQAANGVSRSEWQVLNLLSETPSLRRDRLLKKLDVFLDASRLDEIIASLFERGWLAIAAVSAPGTDELSLTDEGRRQHAKILSTQKEVRQQAMQGVTSEEYETLIRVLQRIVANLETGLPSNSDEDQLVEG